MILWCFIYSSVYVNVLVLAIEVTLNDIRSYILV